MTRGRLLDLAVLALIAPLVLPVLGLACLVLLATDGRPVFYASERMRSPDRAFFCHKLRTMHGRDTADTSGVLGGFRQAEITRTGRIFRKLRIDELPQIWNVIRGDMRLVGPRPPLRRYVASHPDLYARVLRARPGVTGLATIIFHRHEERLLARARTPEETERIYVRRCIARKARIDLIYQAHASVRVDLYVLYLTAARFAPLPGGRRVRRIYRGSRQKAPPTPSVIR